MASPYTVEQLRRRVIDGTASDTVVRHLDLRNKDMAVSSEPVKAQSAKPKTP